MAVDRGVVEVSPAVPVVGRGRGREGGQPRGTYSNPHLRQVDTNFQRIT